MEILFKENSSRNKMAGKIVQITPIMSLLDLNGNSTNFSVRGHVQATGDFSYTLATQKQIDDGQLKFQRSENGYAIVSASSNPGQPFQSHYMVVQSDKPVQANFWVESIPLIKDIPVSSTAKRNLTPLVWIALLIAIVFLIARKKGN